MVAEVNGILLYYEKTGSGRPLILVHGNGEDHTIFKEAADILKNHFTCYLLDSRGHGKSSAAVPLHYEDMADDLLGFMEQMDLRDAVFMGFSDGGIVGLLAASRTDRISELITAGANVSPAGVKDHWNLLFKGLYLLHRDPKIKMMLREPQISNHDLRRIKARTLVLAGSRDLIKEMETRHIAAMIPSARLRILEGEDHGSYVVHSRKIAELILDFTKEPKA